MQKKGRNIIFESYKSYHKVHAQQYHIYPTQCIMCPAGMVVFCMDMHCTSYATKFFGAVTGIETWGTLTSKVSSFSADVIPVVFLHYLRIYCPGNTQSQATR